MSTIEHPPNADEPTTVGAGTHLEAPDARPDAPESAGVVSEASGALPRIGSVREIADATDRPEREVDVPEWGGSVLMRGLSLGTIDELQTEHPGGGYTYLLKLVAMTIVDPPFTTEQASVLSGKSAVVMERVIAEALRLNGLGEALERALVEQFPDGRTETDGVPARAGAEDDGGAAA